MDQAPIPSPWVETEIAYSPARLPGFEGFLPIEAALPGVYQRFQEALWSVPGGLGQGEQSIVGVPEKERLHPAWVAVGPQPHTELRKEPGQNART